MYLRVEMSKSGIMQLCDEAEKKYGPRLENLIKTALPDDRLSHIFSLSAALRRERRQRRRPRSILQRLLHYFTWEKEFVALSLRKRCGECVLFFLCSEWVGCTQDKEIQMQFHYLL